MLKKMLYVLGVTLLLAFSNAQAAKYDAADDPFFLDLMKARVERIKAEAERGDAEAQCKLAECYDFADCEGIPRNYTTAQIWYAKAAAQGIAEAQNNLGFMYNWPRRASEQADCQGMVRQGLR